ncbi:MAG: DUF6600 domain-containing protein [Candidatus Acidiferrum sp.]
MKRTFLLSLSFLLMVTAFSGGVSADSGHVRIVRLSLVQGDVRYASEFHNDPLTDAKAIWQTAPLNLPIRQGNVLSTGSGRAEVEFENGAMAFLGANTMLEFYDLSLNDGARITRLVLRQGSATFYDRSLNGDYFSVTGGDFSAEVSGHATFRFENFDNGSTVTVQAGRINVLQNDNSTPLEKGHSLSVQASDPTNQVVTEATSSDDFDRWVSNRIQNEQVVSSQTSSSYGNASYVAGYSDLYTYGSWMNVGGYNCWRPFGMGFGWSPFDYGSWMFDGGMGGWSFLGSAPWGWLPYHYGGWIYSPVYGWMWNPGSTFYGRPQPYRPVTAIFVKSGTTTGLVPLNVNDKGGKTPLNAAQGIYPLENGKTGSLVAVNGSEKLTVVKTSEPTLLSTRPTAVAAPTRISRTIPSGYLTARATSSVHGSSITYDPNEHRFVNSNETKAREGSTPAPASEANTSGKNSAPIGAAKTAAEGRGAVAPNSARVAAPPRPSATPAPARTGGGSSWVGSAWGGSGGSSGSSSRSSGSSTGSAHPSGGSSGGGGRPH